MNIKTQTITKVALLSALAGVISVFDVSLPFIPNFYKIDISEVITILSGFALGPAAGVAVSALKNIINLLINGTSTMGVGEFANFIMSAAFVLPAALYYRKQKTRKGVVIAMSLSILSLTIVASLMNYFVLLPVYAHFFGMPMEALIAVGSALNPSIDGLFSFILLAVIPFNIIKGLLTSILVLVSYKKASHLIQK